MRQITCLAVTSQSHSRNVAKLRKVLLHLVFVETVRYPAEVKGALLVILYCIVNSNPYKKKKHGIQLAFFLEAFFNLCWTDLSSLATIGKDPMSTVLAASATARSSASDSSSEESASPSEEEKP